jgi:hypothetical protein
VELAPLARAAASRRTPDGDAERLYDLWIFGRAIDGWNAEFKEFGPLNLLIL